MVGYKADLREVLKQHEYPVVTAFGGPLAGLAKCQRDFLNSYKAIYSIFSKMLGAYPVLEVIMVCHG